MAYVASRLCTAFQLCLAGLPSTAKALFALNIRFLYRTVWKRLKVSKEELCMKIFYSPSYTIATHSFETTPKSGWIAESLAREPIAGIELVSPEPMSAAALNRVHDPEYVDAVRKGHPRELAESQGFHWDPALWEMVCTSNGGVMAAAIEALRTHRVSGLLSSGLHHARRARGAGYCTFNGLILAARAQRPKRSHECPL